MSKVPATGTRIRLIAMVDDPNPLPPGSTGTVKGGSEILPGSRTGWVQIRVKWDSGRTLMLSVPPDSYEVIP